MSIPISDGRKDSKRLTDPLSFDNVVLVEDEPATRVLDVEDAGD